MTANPPRFVVNALDALSYGIVDCKYYADSLFHVLDATEPIFVTPDYERFFWKCATTVPGWVGNVLVESAISESDGSARLRKIVEAVDYNSDIENGMTAHANDEARHSRLFLSLVRDSFPSFISAAQAEHVRASLTPLKVQIAKSSLRMPENVLIDYLIQINLSEVRTLMNLHLLAPILWGCAPSHKRERVVGVLQSLQRDEVRHISYTAHIVEQWAAGGDADIVAGLFARNIADFNRYSVEGTRAAVKRYGQGQFPRLLLD